MSSNIFLISIFFLFFSTLLFWVSDLLHPSSVSLGLSYIVSFPIFSIYFIWQCQILIVALRAFDLHVGSSSPKRRTNPGPLHWEYGILAMGPPGKYRELSILDFASHTVSVTITQPHCSPRASTSSVWINRRGCFPIKLYLYRYRLWGCSLPAPDTHNPSWVWG